ncbi:MAG: carbohydrate kinase [Acidimicrobium sp. BACL27 MAG-120823-bin4]|nr:MAG: carbohydrate kinase [Acidimicrobium sp. BACL27 MAG-120823-bin4]
MPPVNLTNVEGVSLDALTIGNALVDVLATVDEGFLVRENIVKGSMNLVDIKRSKHLHSLVNSRTEMSGGSAANTAYGLASLGGKAGFIGKISADRLGDSFSHDLDSVGVKFFPGVTCETEDTGRCLIVVTPDGNRTMNTFLGAASLLDAADISKTAVQSAAVVFLEGYLFDKDAAKEAFRTAAEYAHAAGRKVALTLSDSFCVDRHRADFLALVKNDIDILFSNEDELKALYQVDSINDGLHQLRDNCEFAAVTRNEHGSVVIDGDEVVIIDAEPVESVVDATGAGDMYAAGFIYGFVRGKPIEQCGKIGSIVASEVITHMGPRPLVPLTTVVPKSLH